MKKRTNEVAVGIFVIVGFIFLTLILFFVSGVYLFRSGYNLKVMYEYVSILDKGAPVRMAGVRVGEINKVNLFYDETVQQSRVEVKLFIEKGVEIRENYKFTIRGTHILSEPHIEITPVEGSAPILRDGAVVDGVNPVPVESLIDQTHDILENFKTGSESGSTLQQSMDNIEASTASMKDILGTVQEGDGTLGKLVMDDALYNEMDAFVKDIRAHPWKLLKRDSDYKRKWYFLWLI